MSQAESTVTPEILDEIKKIQNEISELKNLKIEIESRPKRKTAAKKKTTKRKTAAKKKTTKRKTAAKKKTTKRKTAAKKKTTKRKTARRR